MFKSKNVQGAESKDGATESDLEREKADVESQGKDLSLPQKDECKEVNVAEEIIPLEKENSENKNPATGAEAAKKNKKKKKKKAAPATSEEAEKKAEEVKGVLGEIDDNKGENAAEVKLFERSSGATSQREP